MLKKRIALTMLGLVSCLSSASGRSYTHYPIWMEADTVGASYFTATRGRILTSVFLQNVSNIDQDVTVTFANRDTLAQANAPAASTFCTNGSGWTPVTHVPAECVRIYTPPDNSVSQTDTVKLTPKGTTGDSAKIMFVVNCNYTLTPSCGSTGGSTVHVPSVSYVRISSGIKISISITQDRGAVSASAQSDTHINGTDAIRNYLVSPMNGGRPF